MIEFVGVAIYVIIGIVIGREVTKDYDSDEARSWGIIVMCFWPLFVALKGAEILFPERRS